MVEKRKLKKLQIYGKGVALIKDPILDLLQSFGPSEFGSDSSNGEDILIKETRTEEMDILVFTFWATDCGYKKIREIIDGVYDVKIATV